MTHLVQLLDISLSVSEQRLKYLFQIIQNSIHFSNTLIRLSGTALTFLEIFNNIFHPIKRDRIYSLFWNVWMKMNTFIFGNIFFGLSG